ncbi:unnamed protein product [Calypogeia fissa]
MRAKAEGDTRGAEAEAITMRAETEGHTGGAKVEAITGRAEAEGDAGLGTGRAEAEGHVGGANTEAKIGTSMAEVIRRILEDHMRRFIRRMRLDPRLKLELEDLWWRVIHEEAMRRLTLEETRRQVTM